MAASVNEGRVAKLTTFFNNVINDRKKLNSSRDGLLFIEALCLQSDVATVTHKIISSASGLKALQACMRFDTGLTFLNGGAIGVLRHLESPQLKSINSGSYLQDMLTSIVDPPIFWDTFTKAFLDDLLDAPAARSFAWLLLELCQLPPKMAAPYHVLAASDNVISRLLKSIDGETRNFGQKIKHLLPLDPTELQNSGMVAGGRHDNDHKNYKEISIMPTTDELLSKDIPFLRTSEFLDGQSSQVSSEVPQIHIDNQFRLLREDMLGEIRDEVKILTGTKKGHHKGTILRELHTVAVEAGTDRRRIPWGIKFLCKDGIPQLKNMTTLSKRLDYLKHSRQILRQGNMACLLIDGEPVAFPTIYRDEADLAKDVPIVTLQFVNDDSLVYTLSKLKLAQDVAIAQLDTATFAFEPFLTRLQQMSFVPLSEELFYTTGDAKLNAPSFQPKQILEQLEKKSGQDIKEVLKVKKRIVLDDSQMASLLSCLRQRVSLIQGPSGTGKSFIGALVAKILYSSTKQSILVVCFTNHALDQFLEDLMDIGIPPEAMVRLGSKFPHSQWAQINRLNQSLDEQEEKLKDSFNRYRNTNVNKTQIMEYLEFLDDDLPYFEAFTVPTTQDGMNFVAKRNRKVDSFYLLDQWLRNKNAGLFHSHQYADKRFTTIWEMSPERRAAAQNRWREVILADLVTEVRQDGQAFNDNQAKLATVFAEKDSSILQSKRIIACTTNGAATYASAIQSAAPEVVLVEEAGEILEAHVLTSMGPHTEQLIMIGDHKQLRPKCSYELGVENGDGFDLNRSLFERLILRGYPHQTLTKQHRMRPEISSTIRLLTYPDLTDAPGTLKRSNLRGFENSVMFINHSQPEVQLDRAIELRDGRSSSKQNVFEGLMILKCVKYLAQQGYGSDKIVVLTPYLGQLKLLRDQLASENDPVLNDLDTFDLVRAGLLTDLDTKTSKPSLRLSTIDNYQGEESDIVLVSLTRSNKSHDIGFMAQPERLNVMLSRARDALIMIGNSETFMNARKGKEVWRKLFDHLKVNGHVYDGFPIKCERHPTRTAKLSTPADFEVSCPDGGCQEPCGIMLKCGIHTCPSACHQLYDHSRLQCASVLSKKCANGHEQRWKCHAGYPAVCGKCERAKKQVLKDAQIALEAQRKRDEALQKHQNDLAKLDEQLQQLAESKKGERTRIDQQAILEQKRRDLEIARRKAQQPVVTASDRDLDDIYSDSDNDQALIAAQSPATPNNKSPAQPSSPKSKAATAQQQKTKSLKSLKTHIKTAVQHNASPSRTEWQRQKDQENAHNPAIDEIMGMIGLEDVKEKILQIKARVDTAVRQGTDLKKERLGLVLLGNPGTGKTTVARHYAKVLTSLNVLAGSGFVETTGAQLAYGGVKMVEEHLSELDKVDGGVYFIDEAYQLAQGHNAGGKMVLDKLLTDIENLMGTIIFVFAGYTKQMETFFEHNPGFSSRLPHRLTFHDYKDAELLTMLQSKMSKFYQNDPTFEDGPDGLFITIAVRRLGRGRGRHGFGNARDLENLFQKIRDRQSSRLHKERLQGLSPNDLHFSREDLIGTDPSIAVQSCEAWTELQKLIGLQTVKNSVQVMIDMISANYQRELNNQNIVSTTLNRVFLGSPGTGKTTVAKLFGQVLAHIGVLSNGEVVMKNPADFIGAVIGESEQKTKAILASTVGKVLIIDEAYMLYSTSQGQDIFREAVVDTIVAEVQNVPGDDRCVLLCGYEQQMEIMFQKVNPGLARRFQLKEAFRFEDFNNDELEQILRLKLKSGDLGASSDAISTAIDVLDRARNGLNFGNGGDVENLISKAKMSYVSRQSALPVADRSFDFHFEPQDFDPEHDRAAKGDTNLDELFKGVIGCEDIVKKLRDMLRFAKGLRANNEDPRKLVSMNFVFKGPPGTGKTTTARKFGQVFYDLGLLSAVEVVECSATDLVGQYIGQTGPKTLAQMERGLGKVLFIDEAYRLANGHFAQEAIDELVGLMTQERFRSKMVIILAGYDGDMDRLLEVNQGLRSRFSDDIFFKALTPQHCLQVLWSNLAKNNIATPNLDLGNRDIVQLQDKFQLLVSLPGWGNARDIETLAKRMVEVAYSAHLPGQRLSITIKAMTTCTNLMLIQKQSTSKLAYPLGYTPPSSPKFQSDVQQPPRAETKTSTCTKIDTRIDTPEPESEEDIGTPSSSIADDENDCRDPGVSDDLWEHLRKDKAKVAKIEAARLALEKNLGDMRLREARIQAINDGLIKQQKIEDARLAAEAEEQRRQEKERIDAILEAMLKASEARKEELRQQAEKADKAAAKKRAEEQTKLMELMRLREEERLRSARERDTREIERKRIQAMMEQIKERQRLDAQAQIKLREMGVCPVGYRWIPTSGGYRCAGGTHYVTMGELSL